MANGSPPIRSALLGEHALALLDALHFVLAGRLRPSADDPRRLDRLATWIVPAGLLIGLAWAAAFRAAWRLYGEINEVRVIPALAVLVLEILLTGRLLLHSLSLVVAPAPGPQPVIDFNAPLPARALGIFVTTLLAQWVLIVSIPFVNPWWPDPDDWRSWFNFLYPRPIYRPLILAPLWGRWAMLLTACVGRTAPGAEPNTETLCRRVTPRRLLAHTLLPLVISAVYFSRERNFLIGAGIGMAVMMLTYIAGFMMARRFGGQSRLTLLAAGQIGQLAFLLAYRAAWPLIHL